MAERDKNMVKSDITFIKRWMWGFFILFLVGGFMILRNVYLVQNDSQYDKNQEVINPLVSIIRGDILDRNGRVLACSVPEYTVYFDPRIKYFESNPNLVNKHVDSIAKGLALIFDQDGHDQSYYRKQLTDAQKNKKMIKLHSKNVDYTTLQQLKSLPLFCQGAYKGGFMFDTNNNRVYPFGSMGRRMLGSIKEEHKKENGINGIEKFYNEVLNGNVDSQNPNMKYDSYSMEQINVVSTIDSDIQTITHEELTSVLSQYDAEWGCAIVMEVETGEILAMSNLSHNASPTDSNFYENMNYAVQQTCDPGSTIKLPSLMIALEDKKFTELTDTVDTGSGTATYLNGALTVTDWKQGGFQKLSIRDVFAQSSNVGVSKIINKYYVEPKCEWDYIERYRQMKLTESSGIDLYGEPNPVVKDPSMTSEYPRWERSTLLQMSYGYDLSITPLQILTFYNAVANNGKRVKPRLVKEIRQGATCIKKYDTQVNGTICSKETLEKAHELLEGVVEVGTAKKFKSSYYGIAGKTGTAQTFENGHFNKKKWRGSFCGYFPADKPKYSCIVVIQAKEDGEYSAVGTFKKISDRIFFMDSELRNSMKSDTSNKITMPYLTSGYERDFEAIFGELQLAYQPSAKDWVSNQYAAEKIVSKGKSYNQNIVPNFIGMGMRDVIYLADSLGFTVKCSGHGRVTRQSAQTGETYVKGKIIDLTFGNGQ